MGASGRRFSLVLVCLLVLLVMCVPCEVEADVLKTTPAHFWAVWSEYDGHDLELYACLYMDGQWQPPEQITNNNVDDMFPAVAVDGEGNPCVVFEGEDGSSTTIYMTRRTEAGWSTVKPVSEIDVQEDACPTIAISKKNEMYVVWAHSQGEGSDLVFAKSTDGGASWGSQKQITEYDASPDIMPSVLALDDGRLLMCWVGWDGKGYDFYYSLMDKGQWSQEISCGQSWNHTFGSLPVLIRDESGDPTLLWNDQSGLYSARFGQEGWDAPEAITDYDAFQDPLSYFAHRMKGKASLSWQTTKNESLTLRYDIVSIMLDGQQYPQLSWNSIECTPSSDNARSGSTVLAALSRLLFLGEDTAYAAEEQKKVVCFGDSLVAKTTYPSHLQSQLNKGNRKATVVTSGASGATSGQGLNNISRVMANHTPDFVAILFGHNDIGFAVPVSTTAYNLKRIAGAVEAKGGTPIIVTVTPRTDGYNNSVHRLNGQIRASGYKVADAYAKFDGKVLKEIMSDHLHPNDAGSALLAEAVYEVLKGLIKGKSSGGGGGGCSVAGTPGEGGFHLNFIFVLLVGAYFFCRRMRLGKGAQVICRVKK